MQAVQKLSSSLLLRFVPSPRLWTTRLEKVLKTQDLPTKARPVSICSWAELSTYANRIGIACKLVVGCPMTLGRLVERASEPKPQYLMLLNFAVGLLTLLIEPAQCIRYVKRLQINLQSQPLYHVKHEKTLMGSKTQKPDYLNLFLRLFVRIFFQ